MRICGHAFATAWRRSQHLHGMWSLQPKALMDGQRRGRLSCAVPIPHLERLRSIPICIRTRSPAFSQMPKPQFTFGILPMTCKSVCKQRLRSCPVRRLRPSGNECQTHRGKVTVSPRHPVNRSKVHWTMPRCRTQRPLRFCVAMSNGSTLFIWGSITVERGICGPMIGQGNGCRRERRVQTGPLTHLLTKVCVARRARQR